MKIEITIHHRIGDDEESWQVSDTGGDFDDEEYDDDREAEEDAEGRASHYAIEASAQAGASLSNITITRT